jgi:predicted alpha/beta hydrolase
VTRRHIAPADYGLPRLEHMGFFRDGSQPIWQQVVEWLDGIVPSRHG